MTSYDAAHRSAAVAPRGHRGVLVVRGADRLSWLQGLVTNDVAFDGPGASYAAWLTPQGRMVTDMVVIETGTDTWLDVPAALADALSRRLDLLIFAEDARVEDRSSSLGSLGVYGPSGFDP
jgi:folate-binding Fe-S cluster repair protein YgfZ